MSETFHVKATERGVIRIFMANLTTEEAEYFTEPGINDITPPPIEKALGVTYLDADHVELFPLRNLDGLGLAGYLVDGLGVAEEDVKPHASRLNAMSGYVLIVLSKAFGAYETTITPAAPLKWIGTYTEEGASVKFEPLPSQGAEGAPGTPVGKPPKSDARVGGMIAMYALIAMFVFIGLLIWVAG